jgi:hypothetical protein
LVDRRRVISHTGSWINNQRKQGIGQGSRQADYQEAGSSSKGREEGWEEVGLSQETDPSPKGREEGCEETGSGSQESCPEGG